MSDTAEAVAMRVNGPARVALLTGGGDRPYALGMASCLTALGIPIDFIGSDELDSPELRQIPSVRFLNLRGSQRTDAPMVEKVWRILAYYTRLLRYTVTAEPKIFHVLWNNKFEILDRTVLMLFYRLVGKRIVLTAHNVNIRRRDGRDSWLNRVTLRAQYHLADHVFVHTDEMQRELIVDFGVSENKVSVIPFGVNSTVPNTALTGAQARARLGLSEREKVVLFFGNIAPYKGLEYLVQAMAHVSNTAPDYRLLIVGRPKGDVSYWAGIEREIHERSLHSLVVQHIEYVPDEDTELYFKAADLLVLPYTHVFQSGVLFLGYNFGLPAVVSDVGSLKEDVVEGETGFVCQPRDSTSLAATIRRYFSSDLYSERDTKRRSIVEFVREKHSWDIVGAVTGDVYRNLLASAPPQGRRPSVARP